MGYSEKVYVGPFIKIKKKEVEDEVKVRKCSNHPLTKYTSHQVDYCPECGEKIQDMVEKQILKINWYRFLDRNDLIDKYEDELQDYDNPRNDDYEFLISNRRSYNNFDECDWIELNLNQIADAMTQFALDYGEIMALLSKCGFEPELKFGCFKYII